MIGASVIAGSKKKAVAGPTFSFDKSIDLNGSDEYLRGGDWGALDFNNTDSFTIEGWFYLDAVGGILCSKRDGANEGWMWYMTGASTANDLMRFVFKDTNGNLIFVRNSSTADVTITYPSWNHFAVTYAGTGAAGFKFYINGTSLSMHTDNDDTITGNISNSHNFVIGARDGTFDLNMDGNIYDLAIWDGVMSAAEVLESATLVSGDVIDRNDHSTSLNLLHYPRMGNDSGDSVVEDTGSGGGTIHDRVGGLNLTPIGTDGDEIETNAP